MNAFINTFEQGFINIWPLSFSSHIVKEDDVGHTQ